MASLKRLQLFLHYGSKSQEPADALCWLIVRLMQAELEGALGRAGL
jgi:hypothetical protein